MNCKSCGGKLMVVTSRRRGEKTPARYDFINGDFTVRSLKCVDCGEKATTIEIEESEVLMLEKIDKVKLAIVELLN